MRETTFIEQNKDKWAQYEALLRDPAHNPQQLNEAFVQITDDLSYARTFYPHRSVRTYLNDLAQQIFQLIYKGKRQSGARFVQFWTDTVPQAMWESRKAGLLALGIFAVAMAIGVISSRLEPEFARQILGDTYVNMTLENIERGDPMQVYKESRPLGMSLGIAMNNLFVAFRTALFGVLGSIGTLFILLYNGIMVGAFQYFFIERGLFWQSFLTIWIHGTLEISAIILAGTAGLVAGSGLLFPGTYTRLQAFQLSMRRGLVLFLGIVPIIVLAAIFEGFLTRYTDTPDVLRGMFIAMSLAFVLWYFVWLPWHKARTGAFQHNLPDELLPNMQTTVDITRIKNAGEMLSDAFFVLKSHLSVSLVAILGLPLLLVLGYILLPRVSNEGSPHLIVQGFDEIRSIMVDQGWVYMGFCGLLLMAAMAIAFTLLENILFPQREKTLNGVHALPVAASLAMVAVTILLLLKEVNNGSLVWLVACICLPALCFWGALAYFSQHNPLYAVSRSGAWYFQGVGQGTMVGFLLATLGSLLFFFSEQGLGSLLQDFVALIVPAQWGKDYSPAYLFGIWLNAVWFFFLLYVALLVGGLHFFSQREKLEATSLHEAIEKVGSARQIRGLPKEG